MDLGEPDRKARGRRGVQPGDVFVVGRQKHQGQDGPGLIKRRDAEHDGSPLTVLDEHDRGGAKAKPHSPSPWS